MSNLRIPSPFVIAGLKVIHRTFGFQPVETRTLGGKSMDHSGKNVDANGKNAYGTRPNIIVSPCFT